MNKIALTYNPETLRINEMPQIPPKILRRLLRSNILVTTESKCGSGFPALDVHGKLVVVTAAHIVAGAEHIQVSEFSGKQTPIEDFFSIHTKDEGHGDIDISILRPAGQIGATILRLSDTMPAPGTWITYVNNQEKRTPANPAVYQGIVSGYEKPCTIEAITGLEPLRELMCTNSSVPMSGSSGGLVANTQTGEIIGMSYASLPPEARAERAESSTFHPDLHPATSWIMNTAIIRYALAESPSS